MRTVKLTPAVLRRMIMEEKQKMLQEKKEDMGFLETADVVEPEDLAHTLEKHEDFTVSEVRRNVKKLEMMERAERDLLRKLKEIRESKSVVVRKLRK